MKGKRDPDCDWEPTLGLAILQARMPDYLRWADEAGIPIPNTYWRSHEAIGAFMGISDTAVQHIERIALRKLRVKLVYQTNALAVELIEAFGLKVKLAKVHK